MAEKALWYVVQTYSGYEKTVSTSIEKIRDNRGLQDVIVETCIPMETVTEIKTNGEEHEYQRKKMPGYVFVKMVMDDDARQLVRNVNGCAGFLSMPEVREGSKEAVPVPIPLTPDEVRNFGLESPSDDTAAAPKKVRTAVNMGDLVDIIDGPMKGFRGTVDSVDADAKRANVIVNMWGRETPVDLEFKQVKVVQED